MTKKHFHREDDSTLEQSAHRGCAGSTLVGFLDPAGESPEKPDLTSDPALSRTLKSGNLRRFFPMWIILTFYKIKEERNLQFQFIKMGSNTVLKPISLLFSISVSQDITEVHGYKMEQKC